MYFLLCIPALWLAPRHLRPVKARATRTVQAVQTPADPVLPAVLQIGAQLYISDETVKSHLKTLFAKLNVRDRTDAAICAVRQGIVHPRGKEEYNHSSTGLSTAPRVFL